mgnify:CR=1 FL=1
MIIALSRSVAFLLLLNNIVLLDVHCVEILVLITQVIVIFCSSFFAVSVVFYYLFEVTDLTYWAVVVLVTILLCEALDLWSSTYFGNVWFFCTTGLFV